MENFGYGGRNGVRRGDRIWFVRGMEGELRECRVKKRREMRVKKERMELFWLLVLGMKLLLKLEESF